MQTDAIRVLIIGGYGTFGGRIARLLAGESKLTLLIAGRSMSKARVFIAEFSQQADMIPVTFDRDANIEQQLRSLEPDFVVDASGPFNAYGAEPYRVVKAAIACRIHYLDIADTSDFVCGIKESNASAIESDVFALTGASTCVALSSAVYRQLARDIFKVKMISGGIAPSPHAGVGLSVIRSVAQSAGKPVKSIRNDEFEDVFPFTDSKPFTIAPPGHVPLTRRTFSLADVPDLVLAKTVEPNVENVWFSAAPEPAIYHALLRVLARIVKRGWLRSVDPLSPLMFKAMHDWSWGEHRGGMFIELRGETNTGESITRSWHLVAEGNDGPMVPSMAAAAIIRKCRAGHWPAPGARPALSELELDDFAYYFRQMDIHTGERSGQGADSWPVFREVLDSAWEQLPTEIRQLHDVSGAQQYCGRAQVIRGRSALARIVGRVIGFPPSATDIPVTVTISCIDDHEQWDRDFDGHTFSSVLSVGKGRLSNLVCERFGAAKFGMALSLEDGRLNYVPRGWTFLGIPMPRWLAPQGTMCEYVEDEKFHFHVEIKMPIVGHVVTYKGFLR